MIQLTFSEDNVADILKTWALPSIVAYSQHGEGTRQTWDKIAKTGEHPGVYVALGSHATYFEQCAYEVKDSFGLDTVIAEDDARANGVVLIPDGLPFDVFKRSYSDAVSYGEPALLDEAPWLSFPGRWGERSDGLGQDSPTGPSHQGRKWDDAVVWAAKLTHDDRNWDISSRTHCTWRGE